MNNKGFTLIEAVLIIIGVLFIGQIGYKNYLKGQKESRDMKRRADMEEVERTLNHYYQNFWQYPSKINFNEVLIDPDGKPFVHKDQNGMAERMPVDPINEKPYFYYYESKDKDSLTYKLCANKQEINGKSYCFYGDKREEFKKETKKLYQ